MAAQTLTDVTLDHRAEDVLVEYFENGVRTAKLTRPLKATTDRRHAEQEEQ